MSAFSDRSAVGWTRSRRSAPLGISCAAAILVLGLTCGGCHRAHYREQADAEAAAVVTQATADPRFQLAEFDIAIDPRSRLFDPFDPDCPPMPPDDPDSHRLMQCVDGHDGWSHWEDNGVLPDVETNQFREWLPKDSDGRVRVDLAGAIGLARLHLREYQSQLETLYLSALDVTAERFRFETQFFGGNGTQFTSLGRIRNGGSDANLLTNDADFSLRRFTTTGGTFAAGLANSIVWQFSGNDTSTNTSLLNFAISQPLLQFAGKARVMELLTRSERSLLANVRQYDRFRQGFYLSVATGNGGGGNLQRAGGFFGGSGLTGFFGVGADGFGRVGAGISSSGGFAGGGGVGAQNAGGFLGFLQQQQFIRNQRARIASLRDSWLQLEAAFEAKRLENRFQVDFARQAYSGHSELLNLIAGYESALDIYKIRLGLPPDIPLELNDPFFEQFNLIDSGLTQLQNEVAERFEALSAIGQGGLAPPDVANLSDRLRRFQEVLEQDLKAVEANLPARRLALEELSQRPELKDDNFDSRAISTATLDERVRLLRSERARLANDLAELANVVQKFADDDELEPVAQTRAERAILARVSATLLEVSLWQARTRLHGVSLVPVRVRPETVVQVALARRPDWMNAKASLVDSWRLIEFNANALKSNLSVNLSGDLGTTGDNPVKFRDDNGVLRAGLQIDAPLTRLLERNQYRQSLIDYQHARRSLMAQRDEIHRSLRSILRQIHLDQFNLELRRIAVDVAITQTDIARLKLSEPEKPVIDPKVGTPTTSPTVARDLVDALLNLQQTQAAFIQVWGSYEIQRRLLDFDLGTMALDERGLWLDPGSLTEESLVARFYESQLNPLANGICPPGTLPPGGELPPEAATYDVLVPVPPSPSEQPARAE